MSIKKGTLIGCRHFECDELIRGFCRVKPMEPKGNTYGFLVGVKAGGMVMILTGRGENSVVFRLRLETQDN